MRRLGVVADPIEEVMSIRSEAPGDSCPVARFLDTFDGPWSTLIVRELLTGPKRFGELQRALEGISPKTLSARLKRLAASGVVTRDDRGGVPPTVIYELTEGGLGLAPILTEMAKWADEHLPSDAARPRRPRTTPRRAGVTL